LNARPAATGTSLCSAPGFGGTAGGMSWFVTGVSKALADGLKSFGGNGGTGGGVSEGIAVDDGLAGICCRDITGGSFAKTPRRRVTKSTSDDFYRLLGTCGQKKRTVIALLTSQYFSHWAKYG
jgi:hypothetical protein